jgi:hypothetical protein
MQFLTIRTTRPSVIFRATLYKAHHASEECAFAGVFRTFHQFVLGPVSGSLKKQAGSFLILPES